MSKPFRWLAINACLLLLATGYPMWLSGQTAPHPAFRHYTTDDGLASPEVYHILQDDQNGYIWISTDNGVSRFDGYGFRNFGLKEGLTENVIFMMQFDTLGRLWMQAMSSNLYYLEGDSIHPYWHNGVLENLKERPTTGSGFIVEGAGETVHISTYKYGAITISNDGSTLLYPHPDSSYSQVLEKDGKSLFAIYNYKKPALPKPGEEGSLTKGRHFPVYFHVNDEIWPFPDQFFSKKQVHTPEAFFLGNGQYLFQMFKDTWYVENGQYLWQHEFPYNIKYARIMPDGELFLGLSSHLGLLVFDSLQSFRARPGTTWLPGKTINHIMEDHAGSMWIATHEDGVFYSSVDAFLVYDRESSLPDEKVTALAANNDQALYVGLENGDMWSLNVDTNTWEKQPEIPDRGAISSIHIDSESGQLWAVRDKLYFFRQNNWHLCGGPSKDYPFVYANKITQSPSGQRFWISSFRGFLSLDIAEKQPSDNFFGADRGTFIAREDYSGRVWIGQQKGLFEWKNDSLYPLQHLHPAFGLRVEDIALLPDSSIVIATKGGGIVFWKNGQAEQVTTADGLTADMLECLHAGADGTLWAGTLNGLNRITGNWDSRHVEQITTAHGLPSNEINQIATSTETVWVATNKGLVRFSQKRRSHLSPTPIISSMLANSLPVDLSKKVRLSASENNVTLDFFAINFKMNGRIPYRYRLDGGHWTTTMNRSLNFSSLPFGERRFEVQAQNEDGVWSEPTTLAFEILPPWWATWWARLAGLALCGAAVLGIYKYRTSRLKEAHRIQLQMTELERSALQAQMNPHFIFNCLNSIQNFILQNEKEAAILYLGSFASLVRSTLNASVVGKVTLSEEVKLLTNYLELEKLRFNNRFTFQVKTANDLDVFEIKIPPLLVQPYVENAVIHGISGRQEGGMVEVFFEETGNNIIVSVKDNGMGISTKNTQKESAPAHKSFGMTITKSRLELLSEEKGEGAVSTKTIKGENGEIQGTEVTIKIKIKT